MTKTPVPWDKINKDYVQGIPDKHGTKTFPTFDELSEIYPAKPGTIRNKASKEKWSQQRKNYKWKVTKKANEKKCNQQVLDDPGDDDEAAEFDAENIVKSDKSFEETGEDLRIAVQNNLKIYIANNLNSPYHLKMLGDALSSAQSVVKTAQGEIIERIGVETKNNTDDELLKDPDYILAKRKAMDEFYESKRGKPK